MKRALASLLVSAVVAGSFAATPARAQDPSGSATPPLVPGGPPEARNCSIPAADRRHLSLDSNGRLEVSLDLATGAVTVKVSSVPAGVTCYAIGREPSGTWPIRSAWSPEAISAIESFVDLTARNSAGRYCYRLLFGNPEGHSGDSGPVCIEMPSTIAPTPTATPTTGPTPIPPSSPGLPGPAAPSTATPSATPAPATPIVPEVGNGQLSGEGSSQGNSFASLTVLLATMGALAGLALGRRR